MPTVQGYLAHKKTLSPRILQLAFDEGPTVLRGGGAFYYERGNRVGSWVGAFSYEQGAPVVGRRVNSSRETREGEISWDW